ncbi:hypothetical protein NPX13_g1917 [Xylaria arbuscula]|uniref:Uncharacterized protein n=1 Tax=Xylaria arbuscula TaxID=114810 RepID=A0A9W8NL49_9PEZI|nr:hypothetical protein NPX13_g1917 [Xylaria arbuscula]
MTEFDPDGNIIMDVQMRPWNTTEGGGGPLYRVYKFDWVAQPLTQPSCAYVDGTVYVSWNGATEVHSWALYGGDSPLTMNSLTRVERDGFETSIKPSAEVSFVRVDALDTDGNVIGSNREGFVLMQKDPGRRVRAELDRKKLKSGQYDAEEWCEPNQGRCPSKSETQLRLHICPAQRPTKRRAA